MIVVLSGNFFHKADGQARLKQHKIPVRRSLWLFKSSTLLYD
ncbi:MAG: hypothetical protein ACOYM1_10030 [Methylovulum sp.]